MSTSIGFGYSSKGNADLFNELRELAFKFDYGLLNNIESSELDVRAGLEIAQKHEGWEYLVFLQSPKGATNTGLAFGIEEELVAFETSGKPPKFFDFLNQLADLSSKKCRKIGFFFAGEWHKEDRVRYSYGGIGSLISLLSMPGHWGLRYLIPETGRLQDSDEIPLIFDLEIN